MSNCHIENQRIICTCARDCRLSYGENPESLSHLGLNRYRVVTDGRTDGQTDRIPIANTRSAVPAGTAVARKNQCNDRVEIPQRVNLNYSNRNPRSSDQCVRLSVMLVYHGTDVTRSFALLIASENTQRN